MQDEVNEKTVSLCINGGKISARILKNAMLKALARMEQEKRNGKQKHMEQKAGKEDTIYHGKQSIEETVLCYAQAQIDEMGLTEEVELLGARVYGSRSREGLYHAGSDIDVVLSYSGNLKEDVFFNALHEDGLKVAGILIDINPISIEKTGTLEEYLESADKYLDERQKSLEAVKENTQTGPEEAITFYVAECSEFPVLGEYHEGLETLREAMDLYEKIPAERMNGIKGIGFCLEDGSIYDGTFDLMVAGEVQKEFINEIPHYRESRLVQKAIADMEAILSEREERHKPEPQKTAETALKTDKNLSAGSKKQSVLNALRERQARMKAQEKQGQKSQTHKKGEQEL